MWIRALTAPVVALASIAAVAADTEYLEALARAQRSRPAVIGSVARIAPPDEPGTPLVIHGRVFDEDGKTPARGMIVFAYHTDATGVYDRVRAAHSWRLRGWAKTDRDGRFEFRTIRPAPYPGNRQAAHVHFSIEGPGVPRQSRGLLFLDDPIVSESERKKSASEGSFGEARPVVTRDGAQHVELNLRIRRSPEP